MSHNNCQQELIISWLGFMNKDKGEWSTLIARMLVASNVNAGQAGMAAAIITKGLIWVWWCNVMLLPPTSFVLAGGSVDIIKGVDSMVDSRMPGVKVLS